jgi:hypothetical protein
MKRFTLLVVLGLVAGAVRPANATLLTNGNLDRTHAVEIVPGFFLPKPDGWENVGIRTIGGPYEDEMSSEPWAGPAPTPVTTDGNLNPPPPDGCGGPDCAVFFKPFSGGGANGLATGHLYQDVPGTPGLNYVLTGWAGAEANALMGGAEFALDFLDGSSSLIGSAAIDLIAAGLFTPNGEPFSYKEFLVAGVAPVGTVTVRARASMINAMANPNGGGQAFVVDDFSLTSDGVPAPEPATAALVGLALAGLAGFHRRRK